MLTGKQRAFLRKFARNEEPVFQIGKGGVTDRVAKAVDTALEARELVKLKVLPSCPQNPKEACRALARMTDSEGVSVVGSKLTLFRQKVKESKFDIEKLVKLQ